MQENVHAGHRERMKSRALNNIDSMDDYELLEVLLYSVISRQDVNPVSHRLILYFGSLDGVFNAKKEELLSVKGVGDKIASYILTVGEIYKRAKSQEKPQEKKWKSFGDVKSAVIKMFENCDTEHFTILLLDKSFALIRKIDFSNGNVSSISPDFRDLSAIIAMTKPFYAVISHNHPSGNIAPSIDDDISTAKLNNLCEVHGVELVDHIIVGKDSAYSYRSSMEHRLEIIKTNIGNKHISEDLKEYFSYGR